MIAQSLTYASNGSKRFYLGPLSISFAAHIVLLTVAIWSPTWWESESEYFPGVIDVQMVDLPGLETASAKKEVAAEEKAPVVEEEKEEMKEEASQETVPEIESEVKPEISVAKPKKKTKKALKYKTFKSNEVVKNALRRVEKKVDTQRPKPLENTIKRLRDKVAKEGRPGPAGSSDAKGDGGGKTGAFGRGTRKEIELIDLYRLEIAYEVNKNWAYAEQLSAGGNKMMASIAFKVMSDGSIVDIFFTDRSGNQYLDDSAYRAIVKSSPVKPHPEKLSRPYVEMGLRFTPEGVR
jgi:colicin import membrane protein